MAQQYSTKPVNNFIKGLITEASVMSYPEGASSDELNCDLLKNGARQRRRGAEYEEDFQASSFEVPEGSFVHTQTWQNVSGIGGTEFLVVQVDNMVYFYDKSYSILSAGEKSFSINLADYSANNNISVSTSPISVSSSIGYLVIVSAAINPIKVSYDSSLDTISVTKITIEIRDFEYLGMSCSISSITRTGGNTVTIVTKTNHALSIDDKVEVECDNTSSVDLSGFNGTFTVDTVPSPTSFTYKLTGSNQSLISITGEVTKKTFPNLIPSSITNNYQYDLYNMGWNEEVSLDYRGLTTPYEYYISKGDFEGYPPRNKPWWVGRHPDSTDAGDTTRFSAQPFYSFTPGNTLAPNGHYILNFFNQNRSKESGISGVPSVVEKARFNCTASYAGRVWYAGLNSKKNGGKIFFSTVLETEKDFGKCYQKADPTGEDTAGVVDSDGGFIIIPEASEIKALYATGSILYILASNGIWSIGGVDQIFKATEYYVSKISNFGIINSRTLSNVSGTPVYWGNAGIYAITVDNGAPTVNIISDNIKTFYDNISNDAKKNATSVFDRLNNRIYWIYSTSDEGISGKKNNLLILDMTLQAFFPWTVSDKNTNTPYILDAVYLSGLGSETVTFNVFNKANNQVIENSTSGNTVVIDNSTSSSSTTEIKFLVSVVSSGVRKITFATFTNRDFLDWDSVNYSSYAETGYDFQGSATVKKNTPYITTYLKRTEENFVSSGSGYTVDYPSGCILTVKWDLSVDSSRWSSPSQIYRMMNYPLVNPSNLTFTYPYDTIVCRTKVRGKGRVLRMRFESEQGKDFYLIGWEAISAANPRY